MLTFLWVQLLTILSSMDACRFDRIVGCSVVETFVPTQISRFLRTLKRLQVPGGTTLIEVVACAVARMATHAWTNKYVRSSYTCHAITLAHIRGLMDESGLEIHEIEAFSSHYERTFLAWYSRFQAQWHDDYEEEFEQRVQRSRQGSSSSTVSTAVSTIGDRAGIRSLPESFRRTWEFYLLHSAACFRVQALQVYQLRLS